ncbi:MAG: OmpP1/FadL family transporter [Bacteriovoracaceae bacterium]
MKNLFFVFLLCASKLYAGPSDYMLQEGVNSFMARANAATDGKVYASKTNPAGLALHQKNQLGFNLNLTSYKLEDATRDPSATISSGISRDNYQASKAKSVSQYSLGLTLALSNNLVFGLSAFIPAEKLISIYTQTSNESNYLHFNDRTQRPEIYLAGGYELTDNFSFGAGLYLSMKANGLIQIGISENDAESRSLIDAKPVLIPYIGSLYKNNDYLIGLSYRFVNDPKTILGFQLSQNLSGNISVPINTDSNLVPIYDPAQITLGFGLQKENYESYFSLERVFWENYKAPIIELSGDIEDLTGDGIPEKSISFEDTWALRLGHNFKNLFELFNGQYSHLIGFEYHQGATKDSPESIAILDTDKWVVSTGFELSLPSLGSFSSGPVHLNFGVQYLTLIKKTYRAESKSNVLQTVQVGGNVLGVAGGIKIEI